jgi:hypothetical protein
VQFLEIIDKSFVGRFIQNRLNVLEHTDPNRIYLENIRSFYGVPTFIAKYLCEKAVKKGLFLKRVGVECPNEGRLIMTVDATESLPERIYCPNCEVLGYDRHEFALSECRQVEFYKLNVH